MLDIYAFQTDTVWGMGCHPQDELAVDKIYEIKGRDKNKPLILMGEKIENLLEYVDFVPDCANKIIEKYFPAALTLIFKKSKKCPDFIAKNTIAIRIPNHKGFFELTKTISGGVLATTSLNFSGHTPCKNYNEACQKFQNVCKIIKPENDIEHENLPSTIVDFSSSEPKILRQGALFIDL